MLPETLWVFKVKYRENEHIEHFKARLVAKGARKTPLLDLIPCLISQTYFKKLYETSWEKMICSWVPTHLGTRLSWEVPVAARLLI